MTHQYSRDRFDRAPETLARVGAHRAPRRRGRGWITFAWAALATAVLVALGVLGLTQIDRQVADTGATAATTGRGTVSASAKATATTPAVVPTVDPNADVVLLNATTTAHLAAGAKAKLTPKGWHVTSVANASSSNIPTTTVYYTTAAQAGAAAGLAQALGVTRTAMSAQFAVKGQSRLVVVLGKDYAAKR